MNIEGIHKDIRFTLGRDDEAGIQSAYPFVFIHSFVKGSTLQPRYTQIVSAEAATRIVCIDTHTIPGAVQVGTIAEAYELSWSIRKFLASDHDADQSGTSGSARFDEKLLQGSLIFKVWRSEATIPVHMRGTYFAQDSQVRIQPEIRPQDAAEEGLPIILVFFQESVFVRIIA
ncbi:MAG TPA: hypothetical protein VFO10_12005 [Oligoflexus sp.]|nr:hypothetical protein [Oligoflexus sp.]HET9237972.1 hypothetical protein [Oligoflexus sp.]